MNIKGTKGAFWGGLFRNKKTFIVTLLTASDMSVINYSDYPSYSYSGIGPKEHTLNINHASLYSYLDLLCFFCFPVGAWSSYVGGGCYTVRVWRNNTRRLAGETWTCYKRKAGQVSDVEEALSLRTRVSIYIWHLSSFRTPTLWFIDLTVATCHIQYTFPSL